MKRICQIFILNFFFCYPFFSSASTFNAKSTIGHVPNLAPTSSIATKLGFELNKGQWPKQVQYRADVQQGARVYLEQDRFTYVLHNISQVDAVHEDAHTTFKINENAQIDVHAFQLQFVNAKPIAINGEGKRAYYHNYFIGNDESKWASQVPIYDALRYSQLYPGIDLLAYSAGGNFKYDYLVAAGADPSQILIHCEGAKSLRIEKGNLVIVTTVGELVESIPLSYQIINGKKVEITCEYKLVNNTISFRFPFGYDSNFPLVIDPVLMASTYSGSTFNTYGHCATYDGTGNIYTGGRAFGTGYPVTLGAYQIPFGGGVDIAISKLNPTGSSLIYATYIGGGGSDYPHSLFVDSNEDIYIYGSSTSANYPTTSSAFDMTANGQSDMIVSKLNLTGSTLLASTYIGGSSNDGLNNGVPMNYGDSFRGEIIVDLAGNVFIAGTTNSSNFPATSGAYDNTFNGMQDAVVLKLNSTLSTLVWATFIGGTGNDAGCSLRKSSTGEIYTVGSTAGAGFPSATGGLNTNFLGGTFDGFVVKLNASGSTLLNSTFIGTSLNDFTFFIDLDYLDDVYIYGNSTGSMPITTGVFSVPNSQNYICKLSSNLSSLIYGTVIGGGTHAGFSPSALLVDFCQNVYICGWGNVSNYPVTANATQTINVSSCFNLMVFNQGATSLLYASNFGLSGEHVDGGTSRFDKNGIVYQAVCACSGNFPTLQSAFSPTKASNGCDIVVFKIDFQINCNALAAERKICYGQSTGFTVPNINSLSNPVFSCQPGGQVNSTGAFTFAPLTTTNYTLFITGLNSFNSVVTNTGIVTVTVMPQPTISPTFTQATCTNTLNAFNLGLGFLPASPNPTYSIFWSPIPNGVLTNTQFTASGNIAAGQYQATITTPFGCSVTSTFSMDPVPSTASFSVSGPYVVTCDNPVLNINLAPQTYNYFWSGLTATFTGASASFSAGNTGTWVVTGSDPSGGCTGTQSFVITQNTTPVNTTVTPLFQNINCSVTAVTSVSATASPSINISHLWLSPFGGTLTGNGPFSSYPPFGPGTYTHIAVNITNGCSSTSTFVVSAGSGYPTFNVISPQNFTLGCSTKSIITINIINGQATPQGGGVNYALLTPTSSPVYVTTAQSSFTNITIPGNYTVVTKDITTFCETKALVSVLQNTVQPDLQIQTTGTVITCDLPSVLLQGTSTTPNVSYNWTYNAVNGNLPSDSIRVHNTPVYTATLVDNYTLTITDNSNLCLSKIVVPVLQNTARPNVIFAGALPITCKTSSITLTNQSTTKVPSIFNPSKPVVGYLWEGPSPESPLQLKTTYVGHTPGVYTLTAKDLNNGCFGTYTANVVDDRDFPVVSAPDGGPFIFDCGNTLATIYPIVSGSTSNLQYVWEPQPDVAFTSFTTATTGVNKTGHYNITVTNTLNGCFSSGFVEVVSGTLIANFIADPDTGFAPLNVHFTNLSSSSSTLTGTQNIQCAWSFGNGKEMSFVQASVSPDITYMKPGTYEVKLFANKGQCQSVRKRLIYVQIPSTLEVPNIFTPNGDGINDVFFLNASALANVYISITNRWGELVYELESETGNIAWKGQNQRGQDVSEGVYFYNLKAKGLDGESYEQQGTVTLIR